MKRNEEHPSTIAKIATFVVGLSIFQPIYLCLVGSSFAMKRFGYGDDAVSIFVTLAENAMEFLLTAAVLSAAIMMPILKYTGQAYFPFISSGMSMVLVCIPVVTNALLLRLYAFDDSVDNVTKYYWLMVLSHFTSGIGISLTYSIAADASFYFESGTCFIGLSVACFQWVIIKILEWCGLDIDYWLIVSHLVWILLLSVAAAAAWIGYIIRDKVVGTSVNIANCKASNVSALGFAKSLPMILGCTVAISIMKAGFPVIVPFEIVHVQYYYPIMRTTMFMETAGGLALLFIGRYTGATTMDWYTGTNVWWHLMWALLVAYLWLAYICITAMNYPASLAAKIVLSGHIVGGVITVLYHGMGRFIYGLSAVAVSANSDGYGEVIVPLTLGIRQISMNIMKYMSEAYVQQFRLAKQGLRAGKAWPTDGMSKYSAIRYWIRIAATVGYANFRELSTADVKMRLGGVTGRIVSYRRASPVT